MCCPLEGYSLDLLLVDEITQLTVLSFLYGENHIGVTQQYSLNNINKACRPLANGLPGLKPFASLIAGKALVCLDGGST